MARTIMLLSTAVAGSLLAFAPASASAQRWGSYNSYPRYGYNNGYSRDARREYREEQKRERWLARKRWEREHRWRGGRDERRRDWDRNDGYRY